MSKTNLYETLGVDKNASQEEIKKAFRDKAKLHHTDKGGDNNKMVALNHAHKILSDKEKRERYDTTGQEGAEQSFEVKFKGLVNEIFIAVIEDTPNVNGVNIIKSFNAQLNNIIDNFQKSKQTTLKKKDKYQSVKKRLKGKGDNVLIETIDAEIESAEQNLCSINANIDFIRKAKEIVKLYSYDIENIASVDLSEYVFSHKMQSNDRRY